MAVNELALAADVARAGTDPQRLRISVRVGRGTGPTELAAFDDALIQAGVADRNLIRLSSIIPPGSVVARDAEPEGCPGGWGDRLYVVMAEERVEKPHEEAWAGIAWCQDPATGAGLFVEHHGHSEPQVRADLTSTLTTIAAARPGPAWGEPEVEVVGMMCEVEPVCALVVATFTAETWIPESIDLRDA